MPKIQEVSGIESMDNMEVYSPISSFLNDAFILMLSY